jgi:mannosyltransferase OCH1-like enzyme
VDYLPIKNLKNSIPKIIHYCWFGSQEMGRLEQDCLNSWKSVLHDFEFRLWNEDSLDLRDYPFAFQAYQSGKYAFVSDVVRLHALSQNGGIYLDTDMLVLGSFDLLLDNDFFTGEYRSGNLNAAIIGSKANHPLLLKLLKVYTAMEFDFLKPKTIPEVFDEVVWGFTQDSVKIYPPDFFYPLPLEKKSEDYSSYLSKNSIAVHLWNHSWKDEFMLLKEYHFIESLKMNYLHCREIPAIYFTRSHQSNYFKLFYLRFKNWIYQSIYGL